MDPKFLTVTALTKYIKKKFDVDKHLSNIWLKGELSNFKHHSRGHMYMTIKDDRASIRAVMFHSQNRRIKFTPENGMKVLLQGYVSVFESQGQYQLYIQDMQPDGVGALHLAYEQLKNKLNHEGLFEDSRKKTLPTYPKRLAVLTSPTGAAIKDILITLQRRYPIVDVLIVPILVQGDQSARSIVDAIQYVNQLEHMDVMILGRGGGSIEELWSFNEEIVARAIAKSDIPIISAIGHETDFTISDFVADLRAPTPTGAAEIAVPSQKDLLEHISHLKQRLTYSYDQNKKSKSQKLKAIQDSYVFRFPLRLVEEKEQLLDRLLDQSDKQIRRIQKEKLNQFSYLEKRLKQVTPHHKIDQLHSEVKLMAERLDRSIKQISHDKHQQFENMLTQLDLLNPIRIMKRGYSIVYSQHGEIIKQMEQVKKSDEISIQLTNGELRCEVKEMNRSESNE
ncbi:exodeoxyribonuclease VII large subunit [Gracilibacillus sp. YIM 98692]|uniref:exodeoxyribonuclease VII large subunit n=1 Tax=Gracilibacillus sp. YIM 98692 TaxID=2663532 RepID=UPI0013D2F62F|nr:exodeoxyribonuclease VII large subunit [Gracilibacillus sp. YIM 98692]